MVERLRDAINKARQSRDTGTTAPTLPPAPEAPSSSSAQLREAMVTAVTKSPGTSTNGRHAPIEDEWSAIRELKLQAPRLEHHRIVSHKKVNPAHLAFDMLRTRLLNMMRTNGWTRLGITSPTQGCGKSMVSTNLALSLGHQNDLRAMLFDVDLRSPVLAKLLDVRERLAISDFLHGEVDARDYLRRAGSNLAFGLNSERHPGPSELFQNERTKEVLGKTIARYRPNIVVYDLPPVLVSDDVIAFLPHVDCVMMVVAAGRTTPKEITEAEQLLADQTNFLGAMLNKSKEKGAGGYQYRGYY
ncbi:MAG TPA: CpsD/CapB family tyrosine-protein kinase [Alphaproteobacteria bacterium]|nr:CpsD/CapB family tyrosine-protein kinase [Alphaproteobacteria bacterium]